MKKTVNLLLLVLLSSLLHAQNEKGQFLIGMSTTLSSVGTGPEMVGLSFTSTQVKVGDNTSEPARMGSVNLAPKFGYFISNNIAIGVDLSVSYKEQKIGESGSKKSTLFGGLGGFTRYYHPLGKVIPFIELDAGLGAAKIDVDSYFFNLGSGLGLAIPIGEKTTLDFLAGYDFIHEIANETFYGKDITANTHSIGFEIGFMIKL